MQVLGTGSLNSGGKPGVNAKYPHLGPAVKSEKCVFYPFLLPLFFTLFLSVVPSSPATGSLHCGVLSLSIPSNPASEPKFLFSFLLPLCLCYCLLG